MSSYSKPPDPIQEHWQRLADEINARWPNDPAARYAAACQKVRGQIGGDSAYRCRVFAIMCHLEAKTGGQWHLGEVRTGRLPCPPVPK